MGMIVFRYKQYYIQEVFSGTKKEYILANNNKEFADGHTHLRNYKSAKYVLFLAANEIIPDGLDMYRIKSLYRILEDSPFKENVNDLIQMKKQNALQKHQS